MIQSDPVKSNKRVLLNGPLVLTPKVFSDERGFFMESWNNSSFMSILNGQQQRTKDFVQDNHSRSSYGVLRGLHYQIRPSAQGKLVRCVVGEILDIFVDIRKSSPTFLQWGGVILSAKNHQQAWIPEGFAHGFLTLSETAEVIYKTTDYWDRQAERVIRWDDPNLGITWPQLKDRQGSIIVPSLSDKDKAAPLLCEVDEVFP